MLFRNIGYSYDGSGVTLFDNPGAGASLDVFVVRKPLAAESHSYVMTAGSTEFYIDEHVDSWKPHPGAAVQFNISDFPAEAEVTLLQRLIEVDIPGIADNNGL